MRELSAKEKLVLWGLVKYPLLSDQALGIKLNISQSTLTAIKKKLERENYYRDLRIPYLEKLGGELLIATYTKFISALSLQQRLRVSSRIRKTYSEVFYALSDPAQGISLQISKDYTTVKKWSEELENIYSEHGVLSNTGIVILPFPFKLSSFVNFFDFSPLLEEIFEIAGEKGIKLKKFEMKRIKLTSIQKKVYSGLIKYPELSDVALSKKINVSRFTTARWRKTFEGKLMKTIRIVSLEKLDFKILGFLHMKLNLNLSKKDKLKLSKAITKLRSPIFMVVGGNDALALMPFRDFNDFKKITNAFAELSEISEVLKEEPIILLFSIPETKIIKEYSFDRIVEKFIVAHL
ncbi:MAG: hypothetical protein QME47_02610 [Candidatus Thermoplasmatota archaeon]|nr:hypothetical protein [Candidatus Thermoplasmatota archaeon]